MSGPELRYVLLRHEVPPSFGRGSHWDLMLEPSADAPLWTWEVLVALANSPPHAVTTIARRLPDHRRVYLDYEGPLSGDRGHVTRQAAGTLRWHSHDTDSLTATIDGRQLRGILRLRSLEQDRWQLEFTP
jgi:hypothetical protein